MTIIVPVYNDAINLLNCINALKNQTYPKNFLEIIVIDNGSTSDLKNIIHDDEIKLLYELTVQSSYAARNKGLLNSSGDIIAFTDSDCTPCVKWIEEGVKELQSQKADMLSGNVRFKISEPPTGAELWDAITNMQIADNIKQRNVSKTANLFVNRYVFDSVGLFPQTLRSGGDVIWTGMATSAGFKLVYHANAEIEHPARKLKALLKKQFRVGLGQAAILQSLNARKRMKQIALRILPLRLRSIQRMLDNKRIKVSSILLLRVWLAAHLCRFITVSGNIFGLFSRKY
ncbi:MAG: glycosyltransferase [Desulfamplus sp.]|nr:glycosyltransferase [Desulfamplus sp.]